MKHQVVAIGIFVAVALAACGSDGSSAADAALAADAAPSVDSTPSDAGPEPELVLTGIAQCYQALQGDIAERATAIATLKQATEMYPNDARAFIFLGMCSLSALAEDGNTDALGDVMPALQHAYDLTPGDTRIPGWMGVVKVAAAVAFGTGLDEACAYMEMARDLYPAFNAVSLAIAFSQLPYDSGYPQMAAAALEGIGDCTQTDPNCRNSDSAPHNVPGSLMLFGDVYARIGNEDKAREYYTDALADPSAATWPFRADAQDMLDNLHTRVTTWTDADTTNDPTFYVSGIRTCRGCHQ